MLVYEPTEEELELATDWHGGQVSMLYAIASTGSLSTGTQRPSTYEMQGGMVWRAMTDSEWKESLAFKLLREVSEITSSDTADESDRECATEWHVKLDRLHDELAEAAEAEVAALEELARVHDMEAEESE